MDKNQYHHYETENRCDAYKLLSFREYKLTRSCDVDRENQEVNQKAPCICMGNMCCWFHKANKEHHMLANLLGPYVSCYS